MKVVKARINWIYKDRIPPVLNEEDRIKIRSYKPIVVFDGQYKTTWYENHVWSSIIFNIEINGLVSISTLTYLCDKAPEQFLTKGKCFTLYEGYTKVAYGEIVDDVTI